MRHFSSKSSRAIALGVLLLSSAGWGYQSTRAFSATDRDEVLGFDMWCLEMRLYPAARCDARRGEDVKAYQQYRVEVEQYERARTTREKRDQTLLKKLNPDTGQDKPLRPVQ